jgi:repressor LexA
VLNMKPVTDRQKRVLSVIAERLSATGYPPTYRELARLLGMASTNAVADHTRALERKGCLERDTGHSFLARAWRITEHGAEVLGMTAAPGEGASSETVAESSSVQWF